MINNKRRKTNSKENKAKDSTKKFIQIPEQQSQVETNLNQSDDLNHELIDQEMDLEEGALNFLTGLDHKGITRSSKEQKIENRKNRPKLASSSKYPLPKISSHDQNQDEVPDELDSDDLALGSGSDDDLDLLSDMPSSISDQSEFSDLDTLDDSEDDQSYASDDSALEQAYYAKRKHLNDPSNTDVTQESVESKLPIRHPDGTIQRFPKPSTTETSRVIKTRDSLQPKNTEEVKKQKHAKSKVLSDPSLGPRFGRQPLYEILSPKLDLKIRIQLAKVEIAELAQEAIADPEMSLGSIKRIFALSSPTLNHHQNFQDSNIKVDQPIRLMALLSLLAIFLDIIPGYRIRQITEAEKGTKVSQMVARQREWEEGLVSIYKRYLELCETEILHNTALSTCCLKSLCNLLKTKTHFNFAKNIMEIVVRKLGQKEWDEVSETCVESIISVFKNDTKGDDSLQLVRLIVKTIKSKQYSVHPELLKVLLSLRLKNELSSGIRASADKVYSINKAGLSNRKPGKLPWKDRVTGKDSKSEPARISKKARKVMKARAGIEAEIAEAEEAVKVEDKERNQTETLKMIFGCYFRIIKLPYRSNLLPIALESLSRFAHLVNVDFFQDLLEVLKSHIHRTEQRTDHDCISSIDHHPHLPIDEKKLNDDEFRDKFMCVLTAFELLSGQGEALNLDLTDIINSFYDLLLEACTLMKLEEDNNDLTSDDKNEQFNHGNPKEKKKKKNTTSELIMKILDYIFFKQADGPAPHRSNLFTKRILTICLTINEPKLVVKLLNFLNQLASRQPCIRSLFSIFRSNKSHHKDHDRLDHFIHDQTDLDELDLDQVAWECGTLRSHWHPSVRTEVLKLIKC